MDPKEVSPQEHDEFYRFVGSAYDKPRFTLHYRTDAPIDLRCVLYVPEGKPGECVYVFTCLYLYAIQFD